MHKVFITFKFAIAFCLLVSLVTILIYYKAWKKSKDEESIHPPMALKDLSKHFDGSIAKFSLDHFPESMLRGSSYKAGIFKGVFLSYKFSIEYNYDYLHGRWAKKPNSIYIELRTKDKIKPRFNTYDGRPKVLFGKVVKTGSYLIDKTVISYSPAVAEKFLKNRSNLDIIENLIEDGWTLSVSRKTIDLFQSNVTPSMDPNYLRNKLTYMISLEKEAAAI